MSQVPIKKSYFIASSVILAIACSDVANAQESPADDTGIEDIIVTAQRRAENLQKSSLAITTVSGDNLIASGVSQPGDLTRIVPGLQIGQTGPTAQPYIRGVGNSSNTGAANSGVAFSVDGFYIAQPSAYGLNFYDLERMEVLKGPQGTLYGRNATGGAINLITKEPGDELAGNISVEAGSFNLIKTSGGVNIPLGEDLAMRVAFNVVDRNGYFKDGTGDDVQHSGRIRIKWTPANVRLLVNAEYNHMGGVGGGASINDGMPSGGTSYNVITPWDGVTSPYNFANYVTAVNKSRRQFMDTNVFSLSADFTVDIGNNNSVTIQPAYRDVKQKYAFYNALLGGATLDDGYHFKQSSIEGRIAHDGEGLKWVLGAYYFHQNQNTPFLVDTRVLPPGFFGPAPLGTDISLDVNPGRQVTDSFAFFGQATYSLSSNLRVIAGIRYTEETNDGKGAQTFYSKPFAVCSLAAPCFEPYAANVKSTNVSWKAGLEYDLSPSSMLYATAATGYKAGGVFPATAPRNTFRPEKLLAFEFGSRNRFFDDRVQLNLEAYYWRYTDKQETVSGFDGDGTATGGALTNLTLNAGKATIYGASADLIVRASARDTFQAAVEYNHTNYDSYTFTSPVPPVTGCAVTPPGATNPLFSVDCSGRPLTRAPRWTGNASYAHVFPLANGAEVTAGASMNFASSRFLEVGFLPYLKAPAYAIGNFDLAYKGASGNWSITAYVQNVGNKVVAVNSYPSIYAVLPLVSATFLLPPRTYGVRASVQF